MTDWMNDNSTDRFALPDDFGDDLKDLDARLQRAARSAPQPPGLADRVFKASASLLPQPVLAFRPAGTFAWSAMQRWRGGLRLAASVALAACAGLVILQQNGHESERMARVETQPRATTVDSYNDATQPATDRPIDDNEWVRLLLASADHSTGEADYLIDSHDVSYTDLRREVDEIVEALEM